MNTTTNLLSTDLCNDKIDALYAELNGLPETATTQRVVIESQIGHLNTVAARNQGLVR